MLWTDEGRNADFAAFLGVFRPSRALLVALVSSLLWCASCTTFLDFDEAKLNEQEVSVNDTDTDAAESDAELPPDDELETQPDQDSDEAEEPELCVAISSTDPSCDGIDDDCDGTPDDDWQAESACGLGYCSANATASSCVDGVLSPCQAAAPLSAYDSSCDGVDDDCDGFEDEDANCGEGFFCEAGDCVCEGGKSLCDEDCVDLQSNPHFCGNCETDCTQSGQVCNAGVCSTECSSPLQNCDGACVDLQSNQDHCGACGQRCAPAHANGLCVEGSCTVESCGVGHVDVDSSPVNGCECQLANGGVESCDGYDDDCNGTVDDVAGALVAADPLNCGACGLRCDPEGNSAYGTCAGGECGEAACGENTWDNDGVGSNGCEYLCTLDGDGTETCDGEDDDCDGVADQSFDLMSDEQHCGACGVVCDLSSKNAVGVCLAGECRIDSCLPTFFDLDRDPANGCEFEHPGAGTIWVDMWNTSGVEDGSETHPFNTINEALAIAVEYDTIKVRPGNYNEGLEITKNHVRVVGTGSRDDVIVSLAPVTLSGNGIELRSMTVIGPPRNQTDWQVTITVAACENCQIHDVVVNDPHPMSSFSPIIEITNSSECILQTVTLINGTAQRDQLMELNNSTRISVLSCVFQSSGFHNRILYAFRVQELTLHGNTASLVSDGSSYKAPLWLSETSDCVVTNNTLGPVSSTDQWERESVSGIVLRSVTNCRFSNNTIQNVAGSHSVDKGMGFTPHGGSAAAFVFDGNTTGNTFDGNIVENLVGGTAEPVAVPDRSGINGSTAVFAVSEWSHFDNVFEKSNTLDGRSLDGCFYEQLNNVTISQTTIDPWCSKWFSVAALVINNVDDVIIEQVVSNSVLIRNASTLTITDSQLGSFPESRSGNPFLPEPTFGLRVAGCEGSCLIEDNRINGIHGSPGSSWIDYRTGEAAIGIDLHNSACVVRGNLVSDITGGRGGFHHVGLPGGVAFGIRSTGSKPISVYRNRITSIRGGDGCDGLVMPGESGNGGSAGQAMGIDIQSGMGNQSSNNTIHNIASGLPGQPAGTGASGSVPESLAIVVGANASLAVASTIFSSIQGPACANDSANPAHQLLMKNNLFFDLSSIGSNLSSQPGTNLEGLDPLFVDPANGDFHLQCGPDPGDPCSPAIDAGDPSSSYTNEPSPNGCRVNLGAYGNTSEAASIPGASHCP